MSSLIEKSYKVAEMEKRADGADTSVQFFLRGCANFLAVYTQIRWNTVLIVQR